MRQRASGPGVRGHVAATAEVAGMARAWQALAAGRVLVVTAGGMARPPTPVYTPLSQGHEGNLTWLTVT